MGTTLGSLNFLLHPQLQTLNHYLLKYEPEPIELDTGFRRDSMGDSEILIIKLYQPAPQRGKLLLQPSSIGLHQNPWLGTKVRSTI